MGECKEVGAGILRLVAVLENEVNGAGQGQQRGSPALCFSCGPLTKGSEEVKLLSEEKLKVLLRALLVSHEDEEEILRRMKDPVNANVCGRCDKSLGVLVHLYQQLEGVRLQFSAVRWQVGRQMISGSLRMAESFGKWLTDVESVKDVFPSKAPKKLSRSIRSKDVAIGTDEVQLETEDGNERLKSRGNTGGVTSAGSTRKGASEKNVSLSSMKTCRVILERMCEGPANNLRPATPRKRRIATHEKQHGSGEASSDLPSTTERPRRAVAMKKPSTESNKQFAGGSLKRRSKFTRKPSTMWHSVKVPNKTSGEIHYYRRCKLCPKLSRTNYIVRRHCYLAHKAEYVKDLPFACRVCYYLFPSANTLEVHKKKHESVRCPTCHKYFPFQVKLKDHIMRTHTGEKPFACDVCDQRFFRKDQAKEHMVSHTGVKPFVCSCGKGFTQKNSFKRHQTTTGHSELQVK